MTDHDIVNGVIFSDATSCRATMESAERPARYSILLEFGLRCRGVGVRSVHKRQSWPLRMNNENPKQRAFLKSYLRPSCCQKVSQRFEKWGDTDQLREDA